ncbi:MAG: protein kinase [Deltaproteobacteria bacterium]|nr:protein kinase [Deltaproteobacteria bacterium]
MIAERIRLGPFELLEPIGRGGMAEVWRGVHREQDVPVAIKVITGARAREERFQATFRTEVQAMARLDHPAIVLVLDHGKVSEEAAHLSGGELHQGSPYLVMELASYGALDRVQGALAWPELVRTLLALLDALAHAHARGVIHRDLKPANVLLSAPSDLRPGLKLTDFGIAHALGEERVETEATATSGTPHFMAPEQFMAEWRDYGPWTDLYALGCVAHVLATGKTPFEGRGPVQVAWAHLNAQPGPLDSTQALPRELEAWVRTLMAKEPRDRFQRAADAASALRQIDADFHARGLAPAPRKSQPVLESLLAGAPLSTAAPPTGSTAVVARARVEPPKQELGQDELATVVDETHLGSTLPEWSEVSVSIAGGAAAPPGERLARSIPPLPATWRARSAPAPSLRLIGAGLGLYGLRSIPMVDREEARDHVWRSLAEVRSTGRAQAILFRGAAGNGKSRLAEWLSERADEVGSAIVLRTTHDPIAGPADGLVRMLSRFLRTIDLSRAELEARVEKIHAGLGVDDAYERRALTELLSPAPMTSLPPANAFQFSNPKERHQLILRLLSRLAEERPVVVVLDDIQWGGDALAFVIHALRSQQAAPAPILFLATAREEALADRPVELGLIAELLRQEGTSSLELPPLSPRDHQVLVQELLSLEPELAEQVAARTHGNPLFAVQLVGDWVQRGVLEIGDHGFRLQAGERATIPDDIHEVWSARIARVLSDQPEGARHALELAAVLGNEIDDGEWRDACREGEIEVPRTLVLDLIAVRLAEPAPAGWMFAHGMVRESIERDAAGTWRWHAHQLTAAAMLRRRYGHRARAVAERIGRHLLAGEAYEAALEPLLAGARERWELSEYAEALELLDRREQALASITASESDPRWGDGWVLRAAIETVRGRFDEARSLAERAASLARAFGWEHARAEALRELAVIAYERGELIRAMNLYRQAQQLFEDLGDVRGLIRCAQGLGDVAYRQGDLSGADALYRRAFDLAESVGERLGMAEAAWGLGYVALWRNELDLALSWFQRQLSFLEAIGNQLGIARCYNSLGEVARVSGDMQQAETYYRRALAIHHTIGTSGTLVTRLNLSMVLLARGDFAATRKLLSGLLAEEQESEERGHLAAAFSELLPCDAEDRDFAAWDRDFARARALLEETGLKDGDVAWTLRLAGERALAAGERRRAREALLLSLDLWRAIGRDDKIAEIEAVLARD